MEENWSLFASPQQAYLAETLIDKFVAFKIGAFSKEEDGKHKVYAALPPPRKINTTPKPPLDLNDMLPGPRHSIAPQNPRNINVDFRKPTPF
jgi:hypothetical protein